MSLTCVVVALVTHCENNNNNNIDRLYDIAEIIYVSLSIIILIEMMMNISSALCLKCEIRL